MHAISSYRGNTHSHTHTHTHTQTGPITIHCAAASAQCNNNKQCTIRTKCVSSGACNVNGIASDNLTEIITTAVI